MATPLARLKALQPPTVALINVCDKGAGRAVLAGLEETVGKEMGVFGRILDVEAFDNGIVHVFFADVDNARRCADQLEGTRFDGRKIGAALFADGPPTGPRAEAPGGAAGDRVGAFLDEVLKSTTAASVEALKSTTTASDAATAAADKTATATAPDGEADDGAGEDGTASGCGTASFAATDDDAASWSSFDGGSASDDDSVDGDDASCGQRREREPDGAKPEWMTGALSAAELRRIISAKGASLARPAPKRTKPLGSALFPVANSDSARQRLCGVDAPEESDEAGWLDGPASKPSRSDVPSEIVGGWEEHERGIGSKLMRAMGYNRGEGLGKRSDGRICAPEAVRLHHGPDKAASKTPGLGDAAWREPPKPSERAAKKKRKRHEASYEKAVCKDVQKRQRRNMFDAVNTLANTQSGPSRLEDGGADAVQAGAPGWSARDDAKRSKQELGAAAAQSAAALVSLRKKLEAQRESKRRRGALALEDIRGDRELAATEVQFAALAKRAQQVDASHRHKTELARPLKKIF